MTGISENDETPSAAEASHDQPKSPVALSSDEQSQLARKIMHTAKRNFSKPLKDKIIKLLLFILSFGSHVITINRHGNVIIRNHLLDPSSNILDLLRASVSVTITKPVGFKEFRKALLQINVPKSFLAEDNSHTTFRHKKFDSKSIHNTDRVNIRKWETY